MALGARPAGDEMNERADRLATAAREALPG